MWSSSYTSLLEKEKEKKYKVKKNKKIENWK